MPIYLLCVDGVIGKALWIPLYSEIAQVAMASLPWLIQTHLSPYKILPTAPENKYNVFREIFLFYHEIICCVYSLELPR